MKNLLKNLTVYALVLSVFSLGSPVVAEAGIISTFEAVTVQQRESSLATLNEALAREEVRAELAAMGVEPAQVEARLAALTTAELNAMADRVATMPAGAGALEVIGIVFLVLLILEAVGVLDIFSRFP